MKIKKTFLKSSFILLSLASLIGCGPATNSISSSEVSSSNQDVSTSEPSSETPSSSSSSSSSETSSSSEESSSEITPTIVDFDVINNYQTYKIGDKFLQYADLHFYAILSDKTYLDISDATQYKVKKIIPPNEGNMLASGRFTYQGKHEVFIDFTYENKLYHDAISTNVIGGLKAGYTPKSINITNVPKAYINSLFVPNNELKFDVIWQDNIVEHVTYDSSDKDYELSLYLSDDLSHTNIIDQKIKENKQYTFQVKIKGFDVSCKQSLEVLNSLGFVKLDKLTMVSQDVVPTYSTAIGKLNVLVIPVELDATGFYDAKHWNDKDLEKANKEMFGTKQDTFNGWNSLKTYYETASYGQLEIGGMVAEVYHETDESLTMQAINNDTSYHKLTSLLKRATEHTIKSHPEIDWTQYDLNNDGCLDATHIITNAGQRSVEWADPLWPHFTHTNLFGEHESPAVNAYSLSSLGHFESARTQIHEQGHMLGLEDYYDYTDLSRADYIGGFDMQDMNVLDWNSFSKMEVGWVKPYVIDGTQSTTRVTLSPASVNGDCLVIPANFNTYNQSAYDEYFLIELFTPNGNNASDWYNLYDYSSVNPKKVDLGEYGVRMYHVDARLWGYDSQDKIDNGREIKNIDDLKQMSFENCDIGTNNSSDAKAYTRPSPTAWHDYKLLTLIQAGKVDTFSKGELLNKDDLFHQGDVFRFEDYDHFLSKKGNACPSMDNGETFPYTITFKEMTKDKVIVEVSVN